MRRPVGEPDGFERELLIAAVAAKRLSLALELAARELRAARKSDSIRGVSRHEPGLTLLKEVLAEGPDPRGIRTEER